MSDHQRKDSESGVPPVPDNTPVDSPDRLRSIEDPHMPTVEGLASNLVSSLLGDKTNKPPPTSEARAAMDAVVVSILNESPSMNTSMGEGLQGNPDDKSVPQTIKDGAQNEASAVGNPGAKVIEPANEAVENLKGLGPYKTPGMSGTTDGDITPGLAAYMNENAEEERK